MLAKSAVMEVKWIYFGADVDSHNGAVKTAVRCWLSPAALMTVDEL